MGTDVTREFTSALDGARHQPQLISVGGDSHAQRLAALPNEHAVFPTHKDDAAIWLAPSLEEPGMALAYAVFVAGILQLLFQIPFLMKIRAMPRPKWALHHEGVRRVGRLMLPAIFGSSVAQINVLLGGIIASVLGVGKISLLYYSDRLMEFPLGLFGIALATVTLPYLSRLHANDAVDEFSATLDWSMKLALLIAVPAAVGLIMLSEPLVATLFYGGVFTATEGGSGRRGDR